MNDLIQYDIKSSSEQELAYWSDVISNYDKVSVTLDTEQFIHDGVYYRTLFLPKDHFVIGALIKIPTTVIVSGHCLVNVNGIPNELMGYNVLRAQEHRRQVFRAFDDTYITMCFKTKSSDCHEAEKEFTDEWELLLNNKE